MIARIYAFCKNCKSNNRQFNCRHKIKREIKVIILYVSVDVSRCSSSSSTYKREKKVNMFIFTKKEGERKKTFDEEKKEQIITIFYIYYYHLYFHFCWMNVPYDQRQIRVIFVVLLNVMQIVFYLFIYYLNFSLSYTLWIYTRYVNSHRRNNANNWTTVYVRMYTRKLTFAWQYLLWIFMWILILNQAR